MTQPGPQFAEQFAGRLAELLARQQQLSEHLEHILSEERACLLKGSAQELDQITATKPNLMSDLEALAHEQQRMLQAMGFEASGSGLVSALAWCDQDGSLRALHEQTRSRVRACQQSNEENGLIVRQRLDSVRRALGVLQGVEAGAVGLYGPDGQRETLNGRRWLASG